MSDLSGSTCAHIPRLDRRTAVQAQEQLQKQSAALLAEKARLCAQLEDINLQHYLTQEKLKYATNCAAPIASLPDDVLHMIFMTGQDLEFDMAENYVFDGIRAPVAPPFIMLVSWVYQRWRTIAFSSSALWGTLTNIFGDPSRYLATYLRHSRQAPLHVRLIEMGDLPADLTVLPTTSLVNRRYPIYAETFSYILEHLDHTEWLTIEAGHRTCLYAILPCLRDASVPLLRHLSVHVDLTTSDLWSSMIPSNMFGGGAPLLKSLKLDINVRSCWYPSQSLRSLEIITWHASQSMTAHDFLDFLGSTPSLERLIIYGSVSSGPLPGAVPPPVKLNELGTLHLCLDRLEDTSDDGLVRLYFDHIIAPNLEELEIEVDGDRSIPASTLLKRVLLPDGSSRYPKLASLGVLNGEEPCIDTDFICAHLDMKVMALYNSREDVVFRCLMADDSQGPLWPHLTDVRAGTCSIDLVCDFVSFRARRSVPLERVHVSKFYLDKVASERFEWLDSRVDLVFI